MLSRKTEDRSLEVVSPVPASRRRRRLQCSIRRSGGTLLCLVLCLAGVVNAAGSFGLPECAADFAGEVVLNRALLEAMIAQAEPGGAQPDRQHEMVLIAAKHYLTQDEGLLVLARTTLDEPPIVLRQDCLPYPAATQERNPFGEFTLEQKQVLITYHDLVAAPASAMRQSPGSGDRSAAGNMAPVAAGAFIRGDGQTVVLDAFAIDVYEVTNAQYRQFLEAGAYETQTYWSDEGWRWVQEKSRRQPGYWDQEPFNRPDQPVVGVTWYEADAYCRWAAKELPTELQWEKACRGTDGRQFPWGNDPLPVPMIVETPTQETARAAPIFLTVVGSRPEAQSPYGVHDLAGNVLEWTATEHDAPGLVLLGGSGDSASSRVGCGVSHTLLPGISANFIGFRCLTKTP